MPYNGTKTMSFIQQKLNSMDYYSLLTFWQGVPRKLVFEGDEKQSFESLFGHAGA